MTPASIIPDGYEVVDKTKPSTMEQKVASTTMAYQDKINSHSAEYRRVPTRDMLMSAINHVNSNMPVDYTPDARMSPVVDQRGMMTTPTPQSPGTAQPHDAQPTNAQPIPIDTPVPTYEEDGGIPSEATDPKETNPLYLDDDEFLAIDHGLI